MVMDLTENQRKFVECVNKSWGALQRFFNSNGFVYDDTSTLEFEIRDPRISSDWDGMQLNNGKRVHEFLIKIFPPRTGYRSGPAYGFNGKIKDGTPVQRKGKFEWFSKLTQITWRTLNTITQENSNNAENVLGEINELIANYKSENETVDEDRLDFEFGNEEEFYAFCKLLYGFWGKMNELSTLWNMEIMFDNPKLHEFTHVNAVADAKKWKQAQLGNLQIFDDNWDKNQEFSKPDIKTLLYTTINNLQFCPLDAFKFDLPSSKVQKVYSYIEQIIKYKQKWFRWFTTRPTFMENRASLWIAIGRLADIVEKLH